MQLGRVTGTVVASVKSEGLEGVKFLVVQPLDKHQKPIGEPLVAADAVHMSGPGELVYFVASREAAEALAAGAWAGVRRRGQGARRGDGDHCGEQVASFQHTAILPSP